MCVYISGFFNPKPIKRQPWKHRVKQVCWLKTSSLQWNCDRLHTLLCMSAHLSLHLLHNQLDWNLKSDTEHTFSSWACVEHHATHSAQFFVIVLHRRQASWKCHKYSKHVPYREISGSHSAPKWGQWRPKVCALHMWWVVISSLTYNLIHNGQEVAFWFTIKHWWKQSVVYTSHRHSVSCMHETWIVSVYWVNGQITSDKPSIRHQHDQSGSLIHQCS